MTGNPQIQYVRKKKKEKKIPQKRQVKPECHLWQLEVGTDWIRDQNGNERTAIRSYTAGSKAMPVIRFRKQNSWALHFQSREKKIKKLKLNRNQIEVTFSWVTVEFLSLLRCSSEAQDSYRKELTIVKVKVSPQHCRISKLLEQTVFFFDVKHSAGTVPSHTYMSSLAAFPQSAVGVIEFFYQLSYQNSLSANSRVKYVSSCDSADTDTQPRLTRTVPGTVLGTILPSASPSHLGLMVDWKCGLTKNQNSVLDMKFNEEIQNYKYLTKGSIRCEILNRDDKVTSSGKSQPPTICDLHHIPSSFFPFESAMHGW